MANTKSIGVAFLDQDIIGADNISSSSILGYTADAQGTVTQATDKSTAVTLNKSAGRITMNGAALASNTAVSFTLNNSFISTNDVLVVNVGAGAVADPAAYTVYVSNLASGAAIITVRNLSGTSRSEAIVINFALVHCA
jgi:hypothetical protein